MTVDQAPGALGARSHPDVCSSEVRRPIILVRHRSLCMACQGWPYCSPRPVQPRGPRPSPSGGRPPTGPGPHAVGSLTGRMIGSHCPRRYFNRSVCSNVVTLKNDRLVLGHARGQMKIHPVESTSYQLAYCTPPRQGMD